MVINSQEIWERDYDQLSNNQWYTIYNILYWKVEWGSQYLITYAYVAVFSYWFPVMPLSRRALRRTL